MPPTAWHTAESIEPLDEKILKTHKKHLDAALGKDVSRSAVNTRSWLNYILNHVTLPTKVSGIEEFSWEEPYIMGGWNQTDYEELKKTNASYSDMYDLVRVSLPENHDILMAEIIRISDQSTFHMRLCFLEGCSGVKAVDSIIDAYSYWHYNY